MIAQALISFLVFTWVAVMAGALVLMSRYEWTQGGRMSALLGYVMALGIVAAACGTLWRNLS